MVNIKAILWKESNKEKGHSNTKSVSNTLGNISMASKKVLAQFLPKAVLLLLAGNGDMGCPMAKVL